MSVLPTPAGDLQIKVKTESIASTLPTVFIATTAAAARNGQRLAAPSAQQLSATIDATVSQVKITATSAATPTNVVVGQPVKDKVTIAGARPSYRGTVSVKVFGPFRTTGSDPLQRGAGRAEHLQGGRPWRLPRRRR